MLIKTKIVINLNRGSYPASESWLQTHDFKINEMVVANKTDGKLIPTRVLNRYYRFFIDSASAQEYIDWIRASDPLLEVADFQIVEI